jgi:CubicO group peptidase (beta-lactamase class C family)
MTIRFGSGPPSISSVAPARARRAFQHVREIVPSADIPHDPSKALSLPTATMDVDRLRIPDAQGTAITVEEFLQRASTDALVVLHQGRFVIERYANAMGPQSPLILMSVSKSLLGLLTGILVAHH